MIIISKETKYSSLIASKHGNYIVRGSFLRRSREYFGGQKVAFTFNSYSMNKGPQQFKLDLITPAKKVKSWRYSYTAAVTYPS